MERPLQQANQTPPSPSTTPAPTPSGLSAGWSWLKKNALWVLGGLSLALAVALWFLSGKRSPTAAQKILDIQGGVEQQVARVEQKETKRLEQIESSQKQQLKKAKETAQKRIEKAKKDAQTLSKAALKKRIMDMISEPLE